jgi:antitoxin ParD1/3/4
MNVSLTPELEAFVQKKLETGSYGSQSEVVREGLRLLMERDQLFEARLAELRREIAIGVGQADRGEVVDGEVAFERLRAKRQRKREASA